MPQRLPLLHTDCRQLWPTLCGVCVRLAACWHGIVDGKSLSVMTRSPQAFSNCGSLSFYPSLGLRDSGVEAASGRALAGVGVVHRRLLPHPRHRHQLQGQRVLGQGV